MERRYTVNASATLGNTARAAKGKQPCELDKNYLGFMVTTKSQLRFIDIYRANANELRCISAWSHGLSCNLNDG